MHMSIKVGDVCTWLRNDGTTAQVRILSYYTGFGPGYAHAMVLDRNGQSSHSVIMPCGELTQTVTYYKP